MESSPEATANAVNQALSNRGLPYTKYSSKLVSWDDVSRGTVGSTLSCLGSNITDTYLNTKEGKSLFTIRPSNWNEKLGVVRASDVALLTGNCDTGVRSPKLRPITLEQFLAQPAQFGAAYTGISSDVSLNMPELDDKVSIRFQTVFLPLPENSAQNERACVQFATEVYNYGTSREEDPRNLILLASSQGIALQTSGCGQKRLLLHGRGADNGRAKQYWLEAEVTRHKVGYEQVESIGERLAARKRGKATSECVGIRAMGTRFNALMTVQIPLLRRWPNLVILGNDSDSSDEDDDDIDLSATKIIGKAPRKQLAVKSARSSATMRGGRGRRGGLGRSSAARVSRGDIAGIVPDLSVKNPKRHPDEHVTVTVVVYHCVQGGVPAEEDVVAAIDELETFYAACSENGRLADAKFEFMTKPLAVEDVTEIYEKINS